MNKQAIITILFALAAMAGQAQTKVKGHVVNERGEGVEYVSIGIEEDDGEDQSSSVGIITFTKCKDVYIHTNTCYFTTKGCFSVTGACHFQVQKV